MAVNESNLIWLDLEMTGLIPESDCIIEIATIVTDGELNILEEGPVLAIHQSDVILEGMDGGIQSTTQHRGLFSGFGRAISILHEHRKTRSRFWLTIVRQVHHQCVATASVRIAGLWCG